jgi:hypothetical protein
MASSKDKPLMRSLGEFVGHIIRGIRTDPAKPRTTVLKKEIKKEIKEEDRGDVILRRTTIEEIEVKRLHQQQPDNGAPDNHREEAPGPQE